MTEGRIVKYPPVVGELRKLLGRLPAEVTPEASGLVYEMLQSARLKMLDDHPDELSAQAKWEGR